MARIRAASKKTHGLCDCNLRVIAGDRAITARTKNITDNLIRSRSHTSNLCISLLNILTNYCFPILVVWRAADYPNDGEIGQL